MQGPGQRDRVGEVIAERYRLVERLGFGGQSVVYRALDLQHGDEVALKILTDTSSQDAAWRERIMRESHALTVLVGTAAVRVYHQAWTADGAFCLVMELLRGLDFEDYLRKLADDGRQLALAELGALLSPIVDTLEVAHAAGIVHRDIKPSNIFVLTDGSVRLLDFGFAKFTRMPGLTVPGYVAGSPSYLAPEIWKASTRLDQRIDVYSLGAVIFRALTGRPPFAAAEIHELRKMVIQAPRPSLHAHRPDLPAEVDRWAEQVLAIDPEQRFSRTRAAFNALQSFLPER